MINFFIRHCCCTQNMLKACVGLRPIYFGKTINIKMLWYIPPSSDSKQIRPFHTHYIKNAEEKRRDILKLGVAVLVLTYNKSNEKLVLVRQFRSSIFDDIIKMVTQQTSGFQADLVKYSPTLGKTLELCVGLVDKPKKVCDEIFEECGYDVPIKSLENMYKYRSGSGSTGSVGTLLYSEVCDSQMVGHSDGAYNKIIETVEILIKEAKQLVQQGTEIKRPSGLLIGLLWFLYKFNFSMENISKIWLGPLPADSPYVKPFRMYYVQNGVEKNWDLLKVHDSVAIVLYNTTRQKLVLVRQFRPAVYHGVITSEKGTFETADLQAFPPAIGVTLELCAGIVDKEKSWQEIAREEVLEECGYDVPTARIEEVLVYRSGVGSSGAKQAMYYCEVTDADKVNSGGGVEDEIIEVVELSLPEARRMVQQGAVVNSPPSCLMGLMWFFANKAPAKE